MPRDHRLDLGITTLAQLLPGLLAPVVNSVRLESLGAVARTV
ncbi:hypothetical protein ACIBO1_20665 [Micromonospora sp. NPDC049903]